MFQEESQKEKALREAIYNAIIHKDCTGVQIQMKVFNDHIWLWNDGNLYLNIFPVHIGKTVASEIAFKESVTYKVISMPTFTYQSSSLRILR